MLVRVQWKPMRAQLSIFHDQRLVNNSSCMEEYSYHYQFRNHSDNIYSYVGITPYNSSV